MKISSSQHIKKVVKSTYGDSDSRISKINLDLRGNLLKSRKDLSLDHIPGRSDNVKSFKRKRVRIKKDEVLLYLGCWFFPGKIVLTEQNARLVDETALFAHWNYPQYHAILNFLHGEQILKKAFLGVNPIVRMQIKNSEGSYNITDHALYRAATYMYMNFELVSLPERK